MALEQAGSADWRARRGSMTPPPAVEPLSIGAFTLDWQSADLIRLAVGGRELVRRIGVRVRNSDWHTVPPRIRRLDVAAGRDALTFDVTHDDGDGLEFAWTGTLTSDGDGLVFDMDGTAGLDMTFNRIGICVLHPPAAVVGRAFRASGGDTTTIGEFPELVAPQYVEAGAPQPFVPGFRRLEIDPDGGSGLTFDFEGDLFEIEDQRNWTDASFKTYSTPVARPVPQRISAGQRLHQSVRIAPSGGVRSRSAGSKSRVAVRVGEALDVVVPAIGAAMDSDGYVPLASELRKLAQVGLAHVRADIDLSSGGEGALRRADSVAGALNAALELAVLLPRDERAQSGALAGLYAALRACRARVARVLVFHPSEEAAAAGRLHFVGSALALPDDIDLIGGTRANLAELIRSPGDADGLDGVAFSITPQVHDSDDVSVATAVEAQGVAVRTARAHAGGRPVHVSLVSLKPRFNPYAADGIGDLGGGGEFPPNADPRQVSTFLAAWTIGSMNALAGAGASTITYFEMSGPRGLRERDAGTDWPDEFFSKPGVAYPVSQVVTEFASWSGRPLTAISVPDPLTAIACRIDDELRVLLGNLSPKPQEVALEEFGRDVRVWKISPESTTGDGPSASAGVRWTLDAYGAVLLTVPGG